MIEVIEGIFYNPEIEKFSNQSEEFQAYANEKYETQVTEQVTTTGYPDFNEDGSITFHVDDTLLRAEVTRIQVKPNSTSYRVVKETSVVIFVK